MTLILLFLSFFIFFLADWIRINFYGCPIEQVFFQMVIFLKTLDGIPIGLKKVFIDQCFAKALNLTFLTVILSQIYTNEKIKYFLFRVGQALLLLSIWNFVAVLNIDLLIKGNIEKNFLSTIYIDPENVKFTPEKPKNLILIYIESMENTYRDKTIFGKNLLENLDKLPGISFLQYRQLPFTGWTIAGQFATMCGKEIEFNYENNNNRCLSDILHDHGYYNVYMGGTNLKFTNRGKFLNNHQYDEIYGEAEWRRKGYNYEYVWGLYDDDLLKEAKLKLEILHEKKELFNLTILTGDTHSIDGYLSSYCKSRGASSLEDIVECSTQQINEFVQFIINKGYLKDSNIVIIGDHLFPLDDKFQNKSKSNRYIYNKFISEDNFYKTREKIYHFDLLPNVLYFIGIKPNSNQIAFGNLAFK